MKRLYFLLDVAWKPAVAYVILLGFVFAVLFYKLGSLVPGVATTEQPFHMHLLAKDLGLRSIIENPFFLPFLLPLYILEKLNIDSITALRGISALIGVFVVVSFYYLVRQWYTRRLALLGSALLLSSSWFLHTARLATPDVLYMLPIVLLACGLWLKANRQLGNWPFVALTVVTATLIYVPGLIWILAAGAFWQRKRISQEFRRTTTLQTIVAVALTLLILSPLIRLAILNPAQLLPLLGLPNAVPELGVFLREVVSIPVNIFFRGPDDPTRWVGNNPLLDVFTTALFVAGCYSYLQYRKLERVKLLTGFFIFSTVLIAAGSIISVSILLPFIYIIAVSGLAYLMQQWFDVFPRNPFAKSLALTIVTLTVGLSCAYNLTHYFVAWANAPETRSSFQRLR